ncbi:hypothetical protein ABLV49_01445 [Polaromonas hydrogenivorans]|uniref:Uncharacterized protein n=1 Tax=Polaromonas hydrogenivorans TaxID=335476 RepID=A0AAU7LSF9_9BURK
MPADAHAFTLNQRFAFMPAGIVCPLVKYQAAIGLCFLALPGIAADGLAGFYRRGHWPLRACISGSAKRIKSVFICALSIGVTMGSH